MPETMDMEAISFQMITAAGEAKSCFMEALAAAKEGDFDEAEAKIKEGNKSFVQGHHIHADLIQREMEGTPILMTLLLTHMEDQMMAAETVKLMAQEMIELYQKLAAVQG